MNRDEIKAAFRKSYETFLDTVTDSLYQLFGQQIKIKPELAVEQDIPARIAREKRPVVFLKFISHSEQTISHWMSLDTDLVLKLYALMVGDEPTKKISADHLDGIQEGAKQIMGQLESYAEGQDLSVNFKDLALVQVSKQDDPVAELEAGAGAAVQYSFKIDDNQHKVNHYYWVLEAAPEEATAPEEAVETDEEQSIDVSPAEFQQFDGGNGDTDQPRNLEMLMDVKLDTVVELGRKTIPIRDILKLGRGSIIELEKTAGEPLEIFVNGRKLAEGEVVVVDERFGIRITHLLEPKERIESLG